MTTHHTADGFITANDTEFMAKVAERLNAKDPSLEARVQHTGGGIFCIEVELNGGDQYMYWGTEGMYWRGDLNDCDGNYLDESPFASVPSDSTEPEQVAEAIYQVTRHYTAIEPPI